MTMSCNQVRKFKFVSSNEILSTTSNQFPFLGRLGLVSCALERHVNLFSLVLGQREIKVVFNY